MRFTPYHVAAGAALAIALLTPAQALAATVEAHVPGTEATISEQQVGGETYLFLPSQVSLDALSLSCHNEAGESVAATVALGSEQDAPEQELDDAPLNLSELAPEHDDELGDSYLITLRAADEDAPRTIRIKASASIRSVFIRSEHGRAYIEDDPLHATKDSGLITVLGSDGAALYDGPLAQIKGRGNTTWSNSPKKPYQIKLDAKADLVGCDEPNKTWILLANAGDPTLLRNTVALNLARALGITTASANAPADVYYDGAYLGSYLICEKVEVGDGRIDIVDLEDANDEANANNPAWKDAALATATNRFGKRFTYAEGGVEPSDVSGGYLFEYDYHADPDDITFNTTFGDFTLKSPEPPTFGEAKHVSEAAETAFLRLLAGEDSNLAGSVEDYFDLDDLTRIGWFEEFVGEGDYFYISSTYFALNAGDALIKAVAPWDFDRAFWLDDAQSFHGFLASALLGNPSLQKRCAELQEKELGPLVRDVLLGDEDAASADGSLRSLAAYESELRASRQMDEARWGLGPMRDEWITWDPEVDTTYQANYDKLSSYVAERLTWCDSWVEQGTAGSWTLPDGWYNRGNVRSYVKDGKLLRGWLEDEGVRYNLDPTYAITYRHWQKEDEGWYLILDDGTPASGWTKHGDFWYYFDPTTKLMQTGWLFDNGSWYFLDLEGGWMRRGWVLDRGSWYYIDPNTSHMLRSGWLAWDGHWYYLKEDGSMATQWRRYGDKWYWLGYDGILKHGWQDIDGVRYFFDLFDGSMLTGWQTLYDKRYYFEPSGAMVRGMVLIDGEWNWFDQEGVYLY